MMQVNQNEGVFELKVCGGRGRGRNEDDIASSLFSNYLFLLRPPNSYVYYFYIRGYILLV